MINVPSVHCGNLKNTDKHTLAGGGSGSLWLPGSWARDQGGRVGDRPPLLPGHSHPWVSRGQRCSCHVLSLSGPLGASGQEACAPASSWTILFEWHLGHCPWPRAGGEDGVCRTQRGTPEEPSHMPGSGDLPQLTTPLRLRIDEGLPLLVSEGISEGWTGWVMRGEPPACVRPAPARTPAPLCRLGKAPGGVHAVQEAGVRLLWGGLRGALERPGPGGH